jgi:hypothetical protein
VLRLPVPGPVEFEERVRPDEEEQSPERGVATIDFYI